MTFNRSILEIISIALLLLSCSAKDDTHARMTAGTQEGKYSLHAQRSDQQRRFNLRLQNISDKYLCVRAIGWPSKGAIDDCNAEPSFSLSYAGKTALPKEQMCYEGQSSILIPPQSSLEGYLSYADFTKDPKQIHDDITINLPTGTVVRLCDAEEIEYYHRTIR